MAYSWCKFVMLSLNLYTDFRDFSQGFSSYLPEIMPYPPLGSLAFKRSIASE